MTIKRSETISALSKALVQFNAKVGKISKDAKNPFFKNNYATLDNIIDEVRPILAEYGLNILQMPSGDGQNIQITTLLIHESGEWLESETLTMKPVKNDPQGLGSAITYARRYALQSFLSLNTGEDDDGNNASQPGKQPNANKVIRKDLHELKTLALELGKLRGKSIEEVYTALNITVFTNLTAEQAKTHIENLKNWISQAKAKQ